MYIMRDDALDFWKDIILLPDGSYNVDQMLMELDDYYTVLQEVAKVYDTPTWGRISKQDARA